MILFSIYMQKIYLPNKLRSFLLSVLDVFIFLDKLLSFDCFESNLSSKSSSSFLFGAMQFETGDLFIFLSIKKILNHWIAYVG